MIKIKTLALVAGIATSAIMLAVLAVPATSQAMTTEEQIASLQAQIAALLAQIGGSTSGTSASMTFTSDLTIGSQGAEVTALQNFLIGKGHAISAGATGYFGSQTQAALAAYQAANGIAPAAGYFGPVTRAKVNSMGGSSTPTTPGSDNNDSSDLSGDFGTISDVDELGSYSDEEVGEGEDGVEVLGADVEASNDGDISLTAVKVSFDSTGNTGSDNLDDYISGVTIMLGSKEVGSADVDDFTENGTVWSKTIALSGAKIDADDTAKLVIAVDAANTFDSSDISGDSWTADIDSIKFVDGSGDTTTDTSTGDIDGMDVPVNFVSFSSAADTELKISTASDTPEAGIVIVDDSSETENVSLLKGKLKLEGTSDVVLDEFPVTFATTTTAGTADGINDLISSVTLKIGGEEFSETMSVTGQTGTVTFDNLDFTIEAGDTVEFEVLADVQDADGTVFASGADVKATVTASNRDLMDVENEEGDQLSDSTEKSGTANGEAQEFRTSGIMLTLVSTATDATTGTSVGDDIGLFTIKYKVTAVGDTVYVSSLADATTSGVTDGKTSITVDRSGTATATNISVALVDTTDADLTSVGLYQIEEGESHTFEISASVPMNSGTVGQHRAALSGVRWTTTSSDSTPSNSYTSNLDAFKTSYKVLN